MPSTTTAATLDRVGRFFGHRKPTPSVVAAAARLLESDSPREIAARIRAARKAVVNPVVLDLGPAVSLGAALNVCQLNYIAQDLPPAPPYCEDPLAENSGGSDWAERQPAGTEVARLESSYATYRVVRADLPDGERGCWITVGWWD